mmetsp:Transcript_34869/g.105129  ORF Transcript_34869/g.105129 Transcript_34869/m.105129 type:complete len:265 (-) Transcript_34869:659-1453(-)
MRLARREMVDRLAESDVRGEILVLEHFSRLRTRVVVFEPARYGFALVGVPLGTNDRVDHANARDRAAELLLGAARGDRRADARRREVELVRERRERVEVEVAHVLASEVRRRRGVRLQPMERAGSYDAASAFLLLPRSAQVTVRAQGRGVDGPVLLRRVLAFLRGRVVRRERVEVQLAVRVVIVTPRRSGPRRRRDGGRRSRDEAAPRTTRTRTRTTRPPPRSSTRRRTTTIRRSSTTTTRPTTTSPATRSRRGRRKPGRRRRR